MNKVAELAVVLIAALAPLFILASEVDEEAVVITLYKLWKGLQK